MAKRKLDIFREIYDRRKIVNIHLLDLSPAARGG
jgi:hypothetical protein